MAYPTTTSAGYSNLGVTTLVWGTDGVLVSPAPVSGTFAGTGFYIVESIDQETDVEPIYIENGTGQKASRILINNGQRWTVSVQDDVTMTPPQVNDTVTIKDAANLLGTPVAGTYSNYTGRVVSSGERFSRKGAAMRNITVEYLTLIDA